MSLRESLEALGKFNPTADDYDPGVVVHERERVILDSSLDTALFEPEQRELIEVMAKQLIHALAATVHIAERAHQPTISVLAIRGKNLLLAALYDLASSPEFENGVHNVHAPLGAISE